MKLFFFILTFALIGVRSAEAELRLVEASSADWKSVFTQSVKIDLDVDKEIPGGFSVVLHYQPNTIVKIQLTPAEQIAKPTRAVNLWQGMKNAMRVMLKDDLALAEWKEISTSDYGQYNQRFEAADRSSDAKFGPIWPPHPEFGIPDLLDPPKNQSVDIFVYGVIEAEGYVIPVSIYALAMEWKERSDFLYDNLLTNGDIFYALFSPIFLRENSGFQISEFGGLHDSSPWTEKEGILDCLIGTNLPMVDYWMHHPELDRYLPRLSAKELPK